MFDGFDLFTSIDEFVLDMGYLVLIIQFCVFVVRIASSPLPYGFMIILESGKTLTLCFDDARSKNGWMEAISDAKDNLGK